MKVPTYESRISPQSPSPGLASYDDPGGRAIAGLQQPINQAAGLLSDWRKKKQEEADALELIQVSREASDLEREHFSSNVYPRSGSKAIGTYQDTFRFYEQMGLTYGEKFKDRPEMNLKFQKMFVQMRDSGLNTASTWEAQQGLVAKGDASKALVASKTASVGLFAHNKQRIDQALGEIKDGLQMLSPGRDVTAQVIEAYQNILVNAFSTHLANKDTTGMKMILDNYGELMTGPVLARLQRAYDSEATIDRTHSLYVNTISKAKGDYDKAIADVQEQRKTTTDKETAGDLDAVESQLKKERSEAKLQQTMAEKEATDTANLALLEKLNSGAIVSDDIQNSGLGAKDQIFWYNTMRTTADRRDKIIRGALTEKDKADNKQARAELAIMDVNGTLDQNAILERLGKLNPEDIERYVGLVKQQRKEFKKTGFNSPMNFFAASKKIWQATYSEQEGGAEIYNDLVISLHQWMKENDVNSNDERVFEYAKQLTETAPEPAGKSKFWKVMKFMFATSPGTTAQVIDLIGSFNEPENAARFAEIPEYDRQAIIDILESKGLPVDGPNILYIYQQRQRLSD
jgi:hypothetical protein